MTASTATAGSVRVGTRRDGDDHVGVIRDGRTVVVECGHAHTNRDMTTGANGRSARDCADRILRGARIPATAEHYRGEISRSWERLAWSGAFVHPQSVIAAAKVAAAAAADAYLLAVATVRAVLAVDAARPAPAPAVVEPVEQEIGDMPAWMLGEPLNLGDCPDCGRVLSAATCGRCGWNR